MSDSTPNRPTLHRSVKVSDFGSLPLSRDYSNPYLSLPEVIFPPVPPVFPTDRCPVSNIIIYIAL